MHQTTIRFGNDLWAALEAESGRLGVSAAHYIREATLARLAYAAGRRGDSVVEEALRAAGIGDLGPADRRAAGIGDARAADRVADAEAVIADAMGLMRQTQALAVGTSHEAIRESEALWAQSKLARERARQLRERSESHRRQAR